MNLLQEILTWSQGLPAWQSDAIARLLQHRTLKESDKDDLYALLKSAHGISDPNHRVATPLTAAHVPAALAPEIHTTLLAIKNLHHVNALAEKHRLQFGSTGMTVIYGENGSGKSGYSRVLKRACRARDRSEPIHPNANAPAVGPAEADFEISANGTPQEVHWVDSTTAPEILSSIAIFDTLCARAYLDKEDDFSYVPYGLDVFDGLATLCVDLKAKAEAERVQNAVDLSLFGPLAGVTQVGRMVATLSSATKPAEVEALALLDAEESARHASLSNSLKENDPKEKAAQLQLRERRIAAFEATVSQRVAAVSSSAIAEIERRVKRLTEAQAAAKLAAEEFSAGEKLLPGTGKNAWRALFEAAREFARESHPHEVFPTLSPDSPCPLCQQPLKEGASLLPRLQAYIERSAEREVEAASRQLNALYLGFAAQALGLNADPVLLAELETMDPTLVAEVRAFEKAVLARQQSVIAAVASGDWTQLVPMSANPAEGLQKQVLWLQREREALLQASDASARSALQAEFYELDARVRMVPFKHTLHSAISKLRHIDKLDRCIKALNTRGISSKASELTERAVSADLEQALNREFGDLGVGSLQVSLQSRSFKGKTLHKLVLKLPKAPSPRDVLSEGEQRSIALGSFLAEVGLGGGRGPVVFDDPVSSLDHRRRDAVARRLVTEAKSRQVIVFTHCLYFLYLLDEEAKGQEVPLLTQSLIKTAEGYGIAEDDVPFEGKTTAKRVGALLQLQEKIAAIHRRGEEALRKKETVDAYKLLRNAWERAVEEVLFNEVVLRFRKGVETNRLASVRVDDGDYAMVREGMARCSNYTHDKAILGGIFVPEPDELLTDIRALEKWRLSVDDRNKVTGKERKQGNRPAKSQISPATAATK
jgi:energy-coupling factor transporter ATP-binding protein EcfA2